MLRLRDEDRVAPPPPTSPVITVSESVNQELGQEEGSAVGGMSKLLRPLGIRSRR